MRQPSFQHSALVHLPGVCCLFRLSPGQAGAGRVLPRCWDGSRGHCHGWWHPCAASWAGWALALSGEIRAAWQGGWVKGSLLWVGQGQSVSCWALSLLAAWPSAWLLENRSRPCFWSYLLGSLSKPICLQHVSCPKTLDLRNLFASYWGTYIEEICPRLMTRNKAQVSKLSSLSALQIFSCGTSAKDT